MGHLVRKAVSPCGLACIRPAQWTMLRGRLTFWKSHTRVCCCIFVVPGAAEKAMVGTLPGGQRHLDFRRLIKATERTLDEGPLTSASLDERAYALELNRFGVVSHGDCSSYLSDTKSSPCVSTWLNASSRFCLVAVCHHPAGTAIGVVYYGCREYASRHPAGL